MNHDEILRRHSCSPQDELSSPQWSSDSPHWASPPPAAPAATCRAPAVIYHQITLIQPSLLPVYPQFIALLSLSRTAQMNNILWNPTEYTARSRNTGCHFYLQFYFRYIVSHYTFTFSTSLSTLQFIQFAITCFMSRQQLLLCNCCAYYSKWMKLVEKERMNKERKMGKQTK